MCWPIVAGIVTGIGAAMQASSAKAGHEADRKMQERQETIERNRGAYQAQRKADEVTRVQGSARAGFVANGLALDGSATDVLTDSATEGALDVAAIRYGADLEADNANYRSKVAGMNAKSAGAAIPFAFAAPVINGVARYSSQFG